MKYVAILVLGLSTFAATLYGLYAVIQELRWQRSIRKWWKA